LGEEMARYENLPIYRKGLELSIYLETVVRNFSRYNKYTLGERMRTLALDIVTMTIRANSERDRVKTLEELRVKIEELKTVFHVAKEVKAFPNFNTFAHGTKLLVDLGRQNEGWLKYQRKP